MYSRSTTCPGSAAEKSRLRGNAVGGLHRVRWQQRSSKEAGQHTCKGRTGALGGKGRWQPEREQARTQGKHVAANRASKRCACKLTRPPSMRRNLATRSPHPAATLPGPAAHRSRAGLSPSGTAPIARLGSSSMSWKATASLTCAGGNWRATHLETFDTTCIAPPACAGRQPQRQHDRGTTAAAHLADHLRPTPRGPPAVASRERQRAEQPPESLGQQFPTCFWPSFTAPVAPRGASRDRRVGGRPGSRISGASPSAARNWGVFSTS